MQRKESELMKMMSNPEVSYSRKHPSVDNTPRPPPKSFPDFERERDRGSSPPPPASSKASFMTPPPPDASTLHEGDEPVSAKVETLRKRLGFVEDRATTLENMVEDLTEALTKPKPESSSSAPLVARMVQMAIDGAVSPEVALTLIAQELGLLDPPPKRSTPAFRSAVLQPAMPPPPLPLAPPSAPAMQFFEVEEAPREPKRLKPKKKSKPAKKEAKPWPKAPAPEPTKANHGNAGLRAGSIFSKHYPVWPERESMREETKRLGITQVSLADAIGVNQEVVSVVLRGASNPSPDLIKQMKAAFDRLKA